MRGGKEKGRRNSKAHIVVGLAGAGVRILLCSRQNPNCVKVKRKMSQSIVISYLPCLLMIPMITTQRIATDGRGIKTDRYCNKRK